MNETNIPKSNSINQSLSREDRASRNYLTIACIPAHNEAQTIEEVIIQSTKHVDLVVVCDDGSSDGTGDIARNLGALVVRHERNMGYGAALQSLFQKALELEADVMVTLDGDGQHDPDEIPKILNHLLEGDRDIVIGSRFVEGGKSFAPGWRNTGIRIITNLVSFSGITVSDAQSGFRAYNKKALRLITLTEQGMGASTEILIKAKENGLKIAEVPVIISYENHNKNNALKHGIEVALSTVKLISVRRPLLFYGLPGLISLVTGFVFFTLMIEQFTATRSISTNIALLALGTTSIGLMFLVSGLLLWVLIGVIRERRRSS